MAEKNQPQQPGKKTNFSVKESNKPKVEPPRYDHTQRAANPNSRESREGR